MKKILLIFIPLFLLFIYVNASANQKNNYKIDINYPKTDYNKLNNFINKKIKYYQKLFLDEVKNNNIPIYDKYSLFINYNSYSYKNILSYVFFIEYYVAGAHPNHFVFTINYDTVNNCFIDRINNLDILSSYSREILIKDPRIVNTGMLLDGTKPTFNNFKNFVFTDRGYVIYFERYQIAPYSSGDISLLVPYSILDKS